MFVDQRDVLAMGGHELLHGLIGLAAIRTLEVGELNQYQAAASLTAQW